MKQVYEWAGVSRQARYQHHKRAESRRQKEALIIGQVQQIRQRHPRMGTVKLREKMADWLTRCGFKIGRDTLYDLLRRHGLLLKQRRRGHRTTWPGAWRCRNLLVEMTISRPNQAWVSDLTYIETEEGYRYLTLITDVYSRRIMGYDLSDSLSVEGTLRALRQAVRKAHGRVRGTVLHSDHGIQYTCHAFRRQLARYRMRSSMGEVGNCYDNALAERINGILKLEYGLDGCFVTTQQARRAAREAIWLYNYDRPHLALDLKYPHDVYINHSSMMVH